MIKLKDLYHRLFRNPEKVVTETVPKGKRIKEKLNYLTIINEVPNCCGSCKSFRIASYLSRTTSCSSLICNEGIGIDRIWSLCDLYTKTTISNE